MKHKLLIGITLGAFLGVYLTSCKSQSKVKAQADPAQQPVIQTDKPAEEKMSEEARPVDITPPPQERLSDDTPVKDERADDQAPSGRVEDEVVTLAEQMPEFNGNMRDYVSKNIQYPKQAAEQKKEARVFVQFVIDRDGTIDKKSIKVLKPAGWGFDEEAIRLIAGMPAWKPAKQNGARVKILYTLPVDFKL